MLTNKTTGETRLIVINHDDDHARIRFGDSSRNNIFGKYLTNNGARIALPTIEWKNTHHNMRLIKAGLAMIMQKQLDPNFNVSVVISNPGLDENSHVPNVHDIGTILLVTKKMIELMRDAGETIPDSFLSALSTIIIYSSTHADEINVGKLILPLVGLSFAGLGWYMPKFKQNYFVGFKLPFVPHLEWSLLNFPSSHNIITAVEVIAFDCDAIRKFLLKPNSL